MTELFHTTEHAWHLFHLGDHAQAETIARTILAADESVVEAWFLLAVIAHLKGDVESASDLYQRVLRWSPDHGGANNNLGVLLANVGRHRESIALLDDHLRRVPDDAVASFNVANSLAAVDDFARAAEHYGRTLAADPDHFDALVNFGGMRVRQGRCDEAIPLLDRAVALAPESAIVRNNLGLALLQAERLVEAETHLREAVRIAPQSYEAWTNLGGVAVRRGNLDLADECYARAVQLRPNVADAHNNLGFIRLTRGEQQAALEMFYHAVRLDPNHAPSHHNLGKVHSDQGRFDEAEASLLRAIRLNPNFADAHNLLGLTYFHLGDDARSEHHFNETIRLVPNHAQAQLNRGFLWLRQGDFERGWPIYESRPKPGGLNDDRCSAPEWTGEDLTGRTILVRSEQGMGDVFHFVRYLPLLRARGCQVVLQTPRPLLEIGRRFEGVDRLVSSKDPLPTIDFQVAMLSLPYRLGSIAAPVPYIRADPELVDRWRPELQAIEGFKIGIAWQGDASFPWDCHRSVPLAEFEPLAKIPGVRLISLQKRDGLDQVAAFRERASLIEFGSRVDESAGAFMDTAAIMKNVDLVVTSDSAVAHLAGGLGVPTWLAVHYAPEWRWFLDRDDSPWYPSMRLFRQRRLGDWKDVFSRIASELRQRVAGRLATDCLVPMSPGELLDKISILHIKSERMTNLAQIENVHAELRVLEQIRDRLMANFGSLTTFAEQLKKVNEALWQIEEDIRVCERNADFGPRFIELARSVYLHNDRRAALKRHINVSLGSPLMEEKTYLPTAEP